MKTKSTLSIVGALLAVGMLANTAMAAPISANLDVTATLRAVSASLSVSRLNFGTLNIPATGSVTYNGQVTITATVTSGVPYHLSRRTGSNYMASQSRMHDIIHNRFLSYKLYKDSAHANQWVYSITPSSASQISLTGTGSAQVTTVYATTTVGIGDKAGWYNDANQVQLVY